MTDRPDTRTIDQHPDNPPHIYRADLLAALDSIAVTDTGSVKSIAMDGEAVTITRYVYSDTGGMVLDLVKDQPVTVTHRIEII